MKSGTYTIARGDTGVALGLCRVQVYQSDGSTPATVYLTDGTTVTSNPLTADSLGNVVLTAPDATYVLVATSADTLYTSPPFKLDHFDFFAFKATAVLAGSLITRGFTQTTARLIGRTTAATGAPEEISVSGPLTLSAGALALPLDTDTALAANSNTVVAAQAAIKAYVDNKVNGLSWKVAFRAGTTATLPANTYANGTAGIGATLTGNAVGALAAVDGVTLALNESLLVKNEAAGANNGLYTLTQVGSAGTPYILTRRNDADTSAELVNAAAYVSEGTVNADTQWVCTTNSPITLGTTALAFAQTGATGGAVTSVGLSLPSIFTVSGSPVTTSGTLTAVLATQTAALVWAGPLSGAAAAPTFRALAATDLPMATAAEAKAGTVTKPVGVDVMWSMQAEQTLADAVTTPWDMSLGPNANWTLAASRTLAAPTNMKAGVWYTLRVIQDATGSRTITWPASFNWGTAGAPVLTVTASKFDVISVYCTNAGTPTFIALLGGKGF